MRILQPKHSMIEKMIDTGDGFIILEDDWDPKKGKSNLYKVDKNFEIIWEADRDPNLSAFYNITIRNDDKLIIYDGCGEAELNPDTGELTNWILTK